MRISNMQKLTLYLFVILSVACNGQINSSNQQSLSSDSTMSETGYNKLSSKEEYVLIHKGTERPYTGEYTNLKAEGTFICRQCNAPLYKSADKFDSHCGWPSFDDEIDGAVTRVPDADGRRTEIICSNCHGHLGHVFLGEGFTEKDTRHCVNSISMQFIPADKQLPETIVLDESSSTDSDTLTLGAGCFWCVEAIFQSVKGVESVESGYSGGQIKNPTYKQVCSGNTGHVEVARIVFNPKVVSTETLLNVFWHTHNPTTLNRQGADVGDQYRSVIFYKDETQKQIAEKSLKETDASDLWEDPIVTAIEPLTNYYPAEDYHQNYFNENTSQPYCSAVIAPKVRKFRKEFSHLLKE